MAERRPIPIIVVAGFLGSGKTTLLSRWLRATELENAIVIVNEFGEVGIDDRLIEASSEMVLLDNGCACCTAGEDLAATLERIFWRQLRREIPAVPWVLVETTGIADPASLLAMLDEHPLLSQRFRVAGVITVFDAKHGTALMQSHAECRQQLMQADMVILSKVDLATQPQLIEAEAAVIRLAPHAAILRSSRGNLPVEVALKLARQGKSGFDAPPPHGLVGLPETRFVEIQGSVPRVLITETLKSMHDQFGPSLLRVKGIMTVEGVHHAVQLDRDGQVAIVALPDPKPGRHGITVISRGCPAEAPPALLREILGGYSA